MTGALSRFEFGADAAYARKLMRRYAQLFDEGPVADLGSGRGFFLEALKARGIEGIGVDSSEEAILAARVLGFECIQADAIAFLGDSHDLCGVFASHLIEHLPPTDAERMIAQASQALASGGRFVIVTPNMADFRTLTELYWLDTTHVRPYPARLIAAMMERYGLVVDRVGRGKMPHGKRAFLGVALGRLRHGRDYGTQEVFVSAHKP